MINSGAGNDYIAVNENDPLLTGLKPATVIIEQNDQIAGLQVFQYGTLRIASGATLCQTPFTNGASTLRIDGTLDVSGAISISRAPARRPKPHLRNDQSWSQRRRVERHRRD